MTDTELALYIGQENEIREYIKCRWDTNPILHYSNDEDEPLLFYGGPFSNFVGPFMLLEHPWNGMPARYETVEHWFQANKAKHADQHEQVRQAFNPGKAKAIGQKVDMWTNWDEVKYGVMLMGIREKFASEKWARILLSTGDRYIAEDSPTDAIWGIFNSEKDDFSGKNLLGLALMQVRAELRGDV
jgi:ribA/ribD-fused uncharacterized protein